MQEIEIPRLFFEGRPKNGKKRAIEMAGLGTYFDRSFFTIHKVGDKKSFLKPDLKISLSSSQDLWSKNKHLIVQKKCCHPKSEETSHSDCI